MSSGHGSPIKAIIFAFAANLGVAITKTIAAIFTGSTSMLAEAIHSYADTGNQVLLLIGLQRAKLPATAEHPLGHGKASYFWSFMVAIILFSVGGLFSVYEGWHKLSAPEPVENLSVALSVLVFSFLLEGVSLFGCVREINKIRRTQTLWQWLHRSRNSELIVVFGEDFAALVGLGLAFIFVLTAGITGDGRYDAYGSICIGVLLIVVAIFVSIRVKSLLLGRSADPDLVEAIGKVIADDDDICQVYNVLTLQMGPRVMLAAKIQIRKGLEISVACEKINRLEAELKETFPDIGWCFIEPDVVD
jgi:cation diffusion facilitator family transporter